MGGTYPWWSYTACPVLSLFHLPSHSFHEDRILDISQHSDVADGSVFSLVFDYNLLRNGSDIVVFFFFFQPLGTSHDSHDFSDMMEVSLATTSASSFRTLECMSSSSIDLYTFSLMRWSQTCSSLVEGGVLLPDSQPKVWGCKRTGKPKRH